MRRTPERKKLPKEILITFELLTKANVDKFVAIANRVFIKWGQGDRRYGGLPALTEVVRVDVRSIEEVPASPEHKGTVPVWWLYKPRELKGATAGGYLELVSEFEVKGGGAVHPHRHHTHEFYYVVSGRGRMTIEGETREIVQGDLVHIPPDAVHSLAPVSPHASIRCFCFAVGLRDTPDVNYSSE